MLAFAAALFGGLIATGVVAYLTQKWIGKRERRNRRDDLRLELYLDVVDLVLDNALTLAEGGSHGEIPPACVRMLDQARSLGGAARHALCGAQAGAPVRANLPKINWRVRFERRPNGVGAHRLMIAYLKLVLQCFALCASHVARPQAVGWRREVNEKVSNRRAGRWTYYRRQASEAAAECRRFCRACGGLA